MLKVLQLVGFKSFADRVDFEFSEGITAIVGPNGSGKSNVVDAVRWVLGEQSSKSLRGTEMTDVIFNGSSSRRSLGLAEVTMTFDNSRRVLATDSEEVQIARRVYRSGEGEYLINGHLCRLKDIKNLFLGSGAGSDAYCIIEQGRVDVLLQASTRERRTIFEEAAGISRFKARKNETLRRLERVDQNVQRLRDIIDEVEKQLRSVKLQAAKAQRYQEYSQRLRELRVGLGLQEYHQLSERLEETQTILDRLRAELQEQTSQTENWETEVRRLEAELQGLDEAVREQDSRLAEARRRIDTAAATFTHEGTLSNDLETELSRLRSGLTGLSVRVAALTEAVAVAAGELGGVETQCQEQRLGVAVLEEGLQATAQRLGELQAQKKTDTEDHYEQMRQAARLHNDMVSFKADVDNLRRRRDALRDRGARAAEELASVDLQLQNLKDADDQLRAQLAGLQQDLAGQRQERDQLGQRVEDTRQLIADLRAQRSGLASRIEVLEGLERSQEGLGTGVREVLALLAQPDPGPWSVVVGMVADLLTVRREYAPLIDLVLGERAQRFLVRDGVRLAEALRQCSQPFSGRVSFLALGPAARESTSPVVPSEGEEESVLLPPLPGWGPGRTNGVQEMLRPGRSRLSAAAEILAYPGVIALAEQLVTCDREGLADLPARLLGHTLLVRDLETAWLLARRVEGHRFVTLRGELLEADGALTVGVHHAETGILSRKSELRELRVQAGDLDRRIEETEQELTGLRDQVADLERQMERLQEELAVLAEQSLDLRGRISAHKAQREGLHEEVELSRTEMRGLEEDMATGEASWQQAREQAEAAERQVRALEERLKQADVEIREREGWRQRQEQACTAAKVALAQVEERLSALQARQRQLEDDLTQRRDEQAQGERHLATARTRLAESQRTMLQASAELASCYLAKEETEQRLAVLTGERDQRRQERQGLSERVQAVRGNWRSQQEQAHAREIEVTELRHRLNTLLERLREDYQLDLAAEYEKRRAEEEESKVEETAAVSEESASAAAADTASQPPEAEIAELQHKLKRLGAVNLDSLQELADLEARAGALQVQFDDLSAAKGALEEIIARINSDSRRLFTETFTTIRTHFQELFRKLFGGGMADIVLEDEKDVLESGIEVIARPPGKELRSISLMSGGEKTMTAVALLLAIFRSKPSPFCILDEVDAALDEANIGRFTAVLRDFLDRSQFIIITHSKRTMSVADVLYGVTMQESGISRRVAVRFDDWPNDGESQAADAPQLGSFGGK